MAILTVRNVPDQVHRALRERAALHGRSTEAEVRTILEEAVLPAKRIELGALLIAVGRRAGLTEEEYAGFVRRDASPGKPVDLV